MNIIQRMNSPTPPFFKKMRTIGLILAAIGGVIITTPIALPLAVVTVGGYLIVAGGVATAVSQTAIEEVK